MKTSLLIAIFGFLVGGSLGADAQTLTMQQVRQIAELVLKREHKINLAITKFTYDKNTDIWTCEQVEVVSPDFDIRIEVRDSDRYYRRLYGYTIGPKSNKLRMSPELRREILDIATNQKQEG
jgi:hypothetical protein